MDYIKSFESHLREEGKAEKTIQSYTGDTMGFLFYLKSKELSFDGPVDLCDESKRTGNIL